jgi:hypothetical protein
MPRWRGAGLMRRNTEMFTGKDMKPVGDGDIYEVSTWWVPPFSSLIFTHAEVSWRQLSGLF